MSEETFVNGTVELAHDMVNGEVIAAAPDNPFYVPLMCQGMVAWAYIIKRKAPVWLAFARRNAS